MTVDFCSMALFTWLEFAERLAKSGAKPSVGSFGDSYINAVAATISGFHKAKIIPRDSP